MYRCSALAESWGENLAKRKIDSANKLLIGAVVGFFVVFFGVFAAWKYFNGGAEGPKLGSAPCLPREVVAVRANSMAAVRSPGNVKVYFDASGGMSGYVAQAPNAVGNLTTLVGNFSQSSLYASGLPGKVEFHRFGEYRFDPGKPIAPELVKDPKAFAKPGLYTENNTNIADVLHWIQSDRAAEGKSGQHSLSLVVTDFMLDDQDATDDFEASVGGVLRKMVIEDGFAVGILSVRVPFNGKIFIGGQTFQANVSDRPLVILMIGDPYQVRSFYEYLNTSETAQFSAKAPSGSRGFSVFGLEPGAISLARANLDGVSTGFSARPARTRIPGAEQVQSFTYDADTARSGAKGGVTITLKANDGVKDFEVIGNEPIWDSAIWKLAPSGANSTGCKTGTAWTRIGSLPAASWQTNGQTLTYSLDAAAMKRIGMDQKGVYLIQSLAGQQGITENHPATAWMGEWSMGNAELAQRLRANRSAARMGVPGLIELRNILLTELRMPGRSKIKRTAGQLIIETE